uniref:Uncharacterized protein n=1 Tax=Caenorhabditis japonica TaxID=281687 RepID=A0A8R1IAN6_CAEJA
MGAYAENCARLVHSFCSSVRAVFGGIDGTGGKYHRFDQAIIALGCSVCTSGVYFSTKELIRAINAGDQ